MRYIITFLLIGYSIFGESQSSCNSLIIPEFNDEPPGCVLCDRSLIFRNEGFTADRVDIDFPSTIENNAWFTFYTNEDDVFSYVANTQNCQRELGLEMAIYDENFELVYFNNQLFPNSIQNVITESLKPFSQYFLMIDGVGSDECDLSFQYSVSAPTDRPVLRTGPVESSYCLGAEVCFEVENIKGEFLYDWNIPSGDSILSGGTDRSTRTCLKFKEPEWKIISVRIHSPCQPDVTLSSVHFQVHEGQAIQIDTLLSDDEKVCLNKEKEFFIESWDGSTPLHWTWSPNLVQLIDGGGSLDSFMRVRFVRAGGSAITVDPIGLCGVKAIQVVEVSVPNTSIENGEFCVNSCYQYRDSCYYRGGRHQVLIPLENDCDSIVTLNLTQRDIIPSPEINCEEKEDGVLVSWTSGAESFKVTVNRQDVIEITESEIFLEYADYPNGLSIKVQPLGECTYLPAEISCGVTSTDNNFFNDEIRVFPNPTNGEITIKSTSKIEAIEVYDLTGKLMSIEKATSFTIPTKGVFILKIKTPIGLTIKRVFVN